MQLPSIWLRSSSSISEGSQGSQGSGPLQLSLSELSEEPASPSGGPDDGSLSDRGLTLQEIEDLKGYAMNQLQLLGLFTNAEIMAFAEYVQVRLLVSQALATGQISGCHKGDD